MTQVSTQHTTAAHPQPGVISNQALKDALYKELELHVDLAVQGVQVDPEDYAELHRLAGGKDLGPTTLSELKAPTLPSFTLPHGLSGNARQNDRSIYGLVVEDGQPVLYRYGKRITRISEVSFPKTPKSPLSGRVTSDGIPFSDIARVSSSTGLVHVSFSVECSLKDKGEECKFCNYDNRNSIVKTPRQVAEVFAAAIETGVATSFHLTGGFVPERRELEYYTDVAEEIRAQTGLDDFVGSISMGAPADFTVFDKLKEAGYFFIGSNMEIWDRNIRKAIVPGKENVCGGWDNWVGALEYAAGVFGRARISSNIVAGIETKKSVLEGVEYLASRGILGKAGIWRPTDGTDLEGHQTPEAAWHLDVAYKQRDIYRKYGYSLNEIHAHHSAGGLTGLLYRIEEEYFEDGKLKRWRHPTLKLAINKAH